jgi:thiol-disulfide isomerase/thioredoxin
MDVALLIARLVLSVVFVVAGLAKLVDVPGSQKAIYDFGVPQPLANPLGILLPCAEIAVAIALIPLASAWWGALVALLLLVAFIAGISSNLVQGRTPACHCFGQLSSAPAGPATLVRTSVLALVAGFLVVFGRSSAGLSAGSWFGALALAQRLELLAGVIVGALLVAESWLLLHALRQYGRLLLRIERVESRLAEAGIGLEEETEEPAGLPVSTKAPAFSGSGLTKEMISLDGLRAPGKPLVLIFTNPTCAPCAALMPEVARWQRDYADKLTIAVLGRGSRQANSAQIAEHRIARIVLQRNTEIDDLYQVHGTPSAVLIRPDGTIGSLLAKGPEAIRSLVAGGVGLPVLPPGLPMASANGTPRAPAPPPQNPAGLQIGAPTPNFTLPDLNGTPVSLADIRSSAMLLLFWSPTCSFCQKMLADVRAWETHPPQGAPKLLVISEATVEENRAMGLRSPIVLDNDGEVKGLFGVDGTPMALLLDAQGNIASPLAKGAPEVLNLAGYMRDTAQPAGSLLS